MERDAEFFDRLTDLVLVEGVRELTVATIAARLRCSRRRLYELAPSKEELFCLVAGNFFDKTLEEADRIAADRGDLAAALCDCLGVGAKAAQRVGLPFLRDIEASDRARAIFDGYHRARSKRIRVLIDTGVEAGVFVPCHGEIVTQMLLSATMVLRKPAFLSSVGLSLEDAFGEMYRVLLGGLVARAHPAGSST